MPRGIKRAFKEDVAPTVGENFKVKKDLKIRSVETGNNGDVIMPVGKSKQTDSRRISQRVSKVKRKLDFVYEGDSDAIVKGGEKTDLDKNNNAQLLKKGVVIQKGNTKQRKVLKNSAGRREKVKENKVSLFDGIKVSVNSDKEELDYEDDLPEDDSGSIDQEIDKDVTVDKQPAESLMLGATSSMMTDEQNEQIIMNNPHLRKLLNKMLDERIADAQQRGESSGSQILSRLTPPTQQGKKNTQMQGKLGGGVLVTKSPSDTTIYVPALNRSNRYNELQPELILDSERMKR